MAFTKGGSNKADRIYVRMTEDEKARVSALAAEANLTLSAYVRRRALGLPVHSKADAQTINELRKLGGLVKHIHNQSGGAYSADTAAILVQLLEAIKRVGA